MARPDLSYLKNLFLFLFGLPLGLLTGLTAVSGSVFGVPTVRRLLGLRPARAVAVGLTLTFFAALAGILSYAQHKEVLVGLALVLFFFQTVGALGAERLLAALPRLERLTLLWGTVVTAGGLAMLAQGLGFLHGPLLLPATASHALTFYVLAAVLAVCVGLVSRVFTLGGVLIVPALIYGLGLPPHAAQGTALVVLALASLPGVLAHAQRGEIEPQSATWLSAGAILGALTGALIAVTDLSDHTLIVIFGLLLTVLGLMLLWRKEIALAPPDPPAKPSTDTQDDQA
jgi:uncharacterized membrane protein YfcA